MHLDVTVETKRLLSAEPSLLFMSYLRTFVIDSGRTIRKPSNTRPRATCNTTIYVDPP